MSRILRNDSSNQVIAVIGSIAESLLNNPDTVKCIEDKEGHCFSNCVNQILQNLDIQHPVGSLLQATSRGHHDTYGSCSKTLITMVYYWNRSAQTLLDQGISVEEITQYFQEGVQLCIDALDAIAIPIDAVSLPSFVNHQYRHGAERPKSVSSRTDLFHNSSNLTRFKQWGCSNPNRSIEQIESNVEEATICPPSESMDSSYAPTYLGNQAKTFCGDKKSDVAYSNKNVFAESQNCENTLKTHQDPIRPETDFLRWSSLSDPSELGNGVKQEGYSSRIKESALLACLDGLDYDEPQFTSGYDEMDLSHLSPHPVDNVPTKSRHSGEMESVELLNFSVQDSGVRVNHSGVGVNDPVVSVNAPGVSINDAGVGVNDPVVSVNDADVSVNDAGVGLNDPGVSVNDSDVSVNDSDDVSWYFDSAADANGSIIDADFYAAMANISQVFDTIGGGLNGSRATMEAMFPIPRIPVRGQGQNDVEIGQGQNGVQIGQGQNDVQIGHGQSGVQGGGRDDNSIQIRGQGHNGAELWSSPQIDVVLQSHSLNTEVRGQGQNDIQIRGQGQNGLKCQTGTTINFSDCTVGENDAAANDDISWYFDQSEMPQTVQSEAVSSCIDSIRQEVEPMDPIEMIQSPKPKQPSQNALTSTYSSLKDNCFDDDFKDCFEPVERSKISQSAVKADDDDEFDACFEGVNFRERVTGAKTGTGRGLVSERVKNVAKADDIDDEFDACFEGVKFLDTATVAMPQTCSTVVSKGFANDQNVNNEVDVCLRSNEMSVCSTRPGVFTTKDCTSARLHPLKNNSIPQSLNSNVVMEKHGSKDVDSSKNSLETLLAAKIKEKNMAFKDKIQNSCRHFKTFETSIQEMEKNTNGSGSTSSTEFSKTESKKYQSELLESQSETVAAKSKVKGVDFEAVLAAKLAEKKNTFKNSVQNSCRHLKTFETSVHAMNKSNSCSIEDSEKSARWNSALSCGSETVPSDSLENSNDSDDVLWYFDSTQGPRNAAENIVQTSADESSQHLPNSCTFRPSHLRSKTIRKTEGEEEDLKISSLCSPVGRPQVCCTKAIGKVEKIGPNVEKIGETIENSGCSQEVREILDCLCEGLNHGDPIGMGLAVNVYKLQLDQGVCGIGSLPRFDLNRVHTCHTQSIGLRDPAIVSGFAMEVDVFQVTALQKHTQHHTIMINGDLTPSYKHQGHNVRHKSVQVVKPGHVSGDNWLTKTMSIIQKLNINTILVKGPSSPDLLSACLSRDIAILENLPYKILHAVSVATNTEPLSYINDATKMNVTSEVTISPYREDWLCYTSNRAYLCIGLPLPVQTVMFSHPCQAVGSLREESFWHCANRLSNTLTSNVVLPGSGETEKHILERLESGPNTSYKSAIFEAIAQGFRDYVEKVASISHNISVQERKSHKDVFSDNRNLSKEDIQEILETTQNYVRTSMISCSEDLPYHSTPSNACDTSVKMCKHFNADSCNLSVLIHQETQQPDLDILCNYSRPVLDDYLAKRESWRTAMDFVCQVLRTDVYVVTGLGDKSRETQPGLGFL